MTPDTSIHRGRCARACWALTSVTSCTGFTIRSSADAQVLVYISDRSQGADFGVGEPDAERGFELLYDLDRIEVVIRKSLTPSHAVKGERRYRYYVSRNPINGTPDSGRGGWRLPAPEIERTVASAAYAVLGVRQASQRSAGRVVHARRSSGADPRKLMLDQRNNVAREHSGHKI